MIRKMTDVLLALLVATLMVGLPRALAQNWWQRSQPNHPTRPIIVRTAPGHPHRIITATQVNWVKKYIEVKAGGTVNRSECINMAHCYSMAAKTARHLAYEKLAETIAGLRLTAVSLYRKQLMVDTALRTRLSALVKGARVIREEQKAFPDGSIWVEVTLGVTLIGPGGVMGPTASWARRHQAKLEPRPFTLHTRPRIPPRITGVIIDASGLRARPAMLPKIVTRGGLSVFSFARVSRRYAVKYGLVGYAGTLEAARRMSRVGSNPLVIRAVGVSGARRADLVVSQEDAARILMADRRSRVLRQCRIVAVIN